MTSKTVTFLLVEDDEIDVKVIKRGFKTLKLANPIRVARDGIEAIDILRGTNGHEQIVAPYLILLDINMPRMNGIEFLQQIRTDEDLKSSIVFMLTTSASDQDRISAYNYNVAGYLIKNKVMDSFANSLEMLDHYWKVIEFPME